MVYSLLHDIVFRQSINFPLHAACAWVRVGSVVFVLQLLEFTSLSTLLQRAVSGYSTQRAFGIVGFCLSR